MPSQSSHLILDAIFVAGYCGVMRTDEQRQALLSAYERSGSAEDFVYNAEKSGISRESSLFKFLVEYLLCPAKFPQSSYLNQYRSYDFVSGSHVSDLLWPVLTERQLDFFSKLFSEFALEHSVRRYDARRKAWRPGKFWGKPTDNLSAIRRFYSYFMTAHKRRSKRLCTNHLEDFPTGVVFEQIARAYSVDFIPV